MDHLQFDDMVKVLSFTLIGTGLLVFFLLFVLQAPYGKFYRSGWGPEIKAKWAWMLMEMPSPFLMAWFFITAPEKNVVKYLFIGAWLIHYIYRSFIYPFIGGGGTKPYPLSVAGMAFVFNCVNGFINGYGVFHLKLFDNEWLTGWKFIAGLSVFALGFYINKEADIRLIKMRKCNESKYNIPRGWLFEYISSPHYLGEMIQWTGWALMTFSLPGLAFAVFTFCNLFPRAVASHKWYRSNFPAYPEGRRAIIPFVI